MCNKLNTKQQVGKVLGDLESQVMEIIWQSTEPVSVRKVADILQKQRKIAYTTVMTIMVRLTEKGVLVRHLRKASYLYKPKVTKEQFIARVVHGILSSAVSTLGDGALAHFIKEIQKISPKKRQELLKILSED